MLKQVRKLGILTKVNKAARDKVKAEKELADAEKILEEELEDEFDDIEEALFGEQV